MTRKRDDDGSWAEPCGCVCTDTRWISMCPPHKAENDAINARWDAQRIAARVPPKECDDWLDL